MIAPQLDRDELHCELWIDVGGIWSVSDFEESDSIPWKCCLFVEYVYDRDMRVS